jgi:hypothetical protein
VWRLSSTRVRICLGLQDQLVIKWMPRAHTNSIFDDHLCMERKFHKLTNGFSLTSKFHQNLPSCCVVLGHQRRSFGLFYVVLGHLWGIVPPNTLYRIIITHVRVWVLLWINLSSNNRYHRLLNPKFECLIIHLQLSLQLNCVLSNSSLCSSFCR